MSTRSMLLNSRERADSFGALLNAAVLTHGMPGVHTFIGPKAPVDADPRQLAGEVVDSLAVFLAMPRDADLNMEHFYAYITGGVVSELRKRERAGEVTPDDLRGLADRLRVGATADGESDSTLTLLRSVIRSEQAKYAMLTRGR